MHPDGSRARRSAAPPPGNSAAAQALLSLVRGGLIVLHQIWPEALRRTPELMLEYEVMDATDVVLSELVYHFGIAKW